MPLYTYACKKCGSFEVFAQMADSDKKVDCPECGKQCDRDLITDALSVFGAGISGPVTLGHHADKNADRMSDDEKAALYKKHNAYKEGIPENLPDNMYPIVKPTEKTVW